MKHQWWRCMVCLARLGGITLIASTVVIICAIIFVALM